MKKQEDLEKNIERNEKESKLGKKIAVGFIIAGASAVSLLQGGCATYDGWGYPDSYYYRSNHIYEHHYPSRHYGGFGGYYGGFGSCW